MHNFVDSGSFSWLCGIIHDSKRRPVAMNLHIFDVSRLDKAHLPWNLAKSSTRQLSRPHSGAQLQIQRISDLENTNHGFFRDEKHQTRFSLKKLLPEIEFYKAKSSKHGQNPKTHRINLFSQSIFRPASLGGDSFLYHQLTHAKILFSKKNFFFKFVCINYYFSFHFLAKIFGKFKFELFFSSLTTPSRLLKKLFYFFLCFLLFIFFFSWYLFVIQF